MIVVVGRWSDGVVMRSSRVGCNVEGGLPC